jgi:formate/nitrite transporter FocA (FNT family)
VRPEVAHLVGALAFGIAFVFVVIGKSELFTENFLVPVPGSSAAAARPGSSSPSSGSAPCC